MEDNAAKTLSNVSLSDLGLRKGSSSILVKRAHCIINSLLLEGLMDVLSCFSIIFCFTLLETLLGKHWIHVAKLLNTHIYHKCFAQSLCTKINQVNSKYYLDKRS